jgi:CBS domain-containing protein
MMQVQELMTRGPACCTPDDDVAEAARLMTENDCGCVPVVADQESRQLVGVVTDRDLACRCLGEGKGPDTKVGEVMSANPGCCGPDDDVEEAERIMQERQVRRVPVVDGKGCCVGIVAQADLARKASSAGRDVQHADVARVVEKISEPGSPRRAEARP